ncbi:MAG TPA: glutamate carboxypeptidase [Burkholderiaceae bacterium]
MKPSILLALLLTLANGGATAAAPDKAVLDRATAHKPDAIALVAKLVAIDSGTGNAKGMEQIGAIVADEARKLGMQVELLSAAPAAGNNLVATAKGTGKARILLMAHMDTVFADGTAAARPFTVKGDRAYGPGVMDDKGGIVAALYALKILHELKFTDYARLTLFVNTNEETFSKGSAPLIERLAKEHDVVLTMEPGRPADGLVVWRKGNADLTIAVQGKAAHAGVAPETGRNAAMEAAHQMLQMANLGAPAKLTTVNFTVFNAGDRINVIPNAATVRGDMRASDPAEFDRVEKEMARLAQNKLIAETQVTTSVVRGMVPMPLLPRNEAIGKRAQEIYAELGLKLGLEGSGGAADANISSNAGTPSIDGLGFVGGGIHTETEYLELNSIAPRLYLLTRMIMDLSGKK